MKSKVFETGANKKVDPTAEGVLHPEYMNSVERKARNLINDSIMKKGNI